MSDHARLVLGVDVGSVRRKGGFAWSSSDESIRGQDDPSALGDAIVAALHAGCSVAMAFECPLSVPVPGVYEGAWQELGRARAGEGNRPWSAGAGTGALATGLVELSWVLAYVRQHARATPQVTTSLARFIAGESGIFIAEAMVTSDGKPEPLDGLQDHADAVAAAKRLDEILAAGLDPFQADVTCEPHAPLNLAATAAMHAGLPVDPRELCQDVFVAKVRRAIVGPTSP